MNSQTTDGRLVTQSPRSTVRNLPAIFGFWHILFFLVVVLVADFLAMSLVLGWLQGGGPPAGLMLGGMLGFLAGQCIFLTVFGGLYGTSWIDGFWIGCCVAATGLLMLVLADFTRDASAQDDAMFGMLLFVPGAVFTAYSPMLLMRHFAKWRLLVPGREFLELPSGLNHMFINTALIAGILVSLRCTQLAIDYNSVEFWVSCLAFGFLTVVVAAVVAIPSATLLNCEDAVQRILRLGLFAIAGMLALWLFVWLIFLFVPGSAPAIFYPQTMIAVAVAIVTTFVGFTAIRRDGLRLHTHGSHRFQTDEGDKQQRGVSLQRCQTRLLCSVGIWLAAVILLNVLVAQWSQRREAFRQLMAEVNELAENAGGSVGWYRADQPIIADLHTANDDQVQEFLARWLESDARLEWLDLSGCDMDDSRLAQIGAVKGLVGLKVNDTNVTGRQFSKLAHLPIVLLELNRLDLRQADWMGLNGEELTSLTVNGSQISQTEFAKFLKTTKLVELDAGELNIADELQNAICDQTEVRLKRLGLRGTDIGDQFVRRLKAGGIVRLNLAGTNVTDAVINSLTAMMPKLTDLDLSNTAVTDEGVAQLADHWPSTETTNTVAFGSSLHLANTAVTGEFLVDWQGALPKQLDLSSTKVADTFLDSLPESFFVEQLDLSKTQITDAIMTKLAQKNVPCVAIADTSITARALIQADAAAATLGLTAGVQEWFVSPDQFTKNEMNQFAKAGVTVREFERKKPPR